MTQASEGLIYDGRIQRLACGCAAWRPHFDGIGRALVVAIQNLPVERLMALDAALRGAHEGALVYIVGEARPPLLTMAGMVAKAQPREFAVWSETLPAGTVLRIAPEVSLTPPDALLFVATDGTDDDMVHAQGLAYDLLDRGYHHLGEVGGMRLPARFFAARAGIEEEFMRMADASPEYPGQWSGSI